jgi:two-component system sensor histidine kinase DesK
MSSTEATETQNSLRARGRSPYFLWMIWATWLPFLIPDIVTWLQGRPSLPRMIATLIVLAVFIAFYLWTTLQNARRLVARSSSVGRTEIPVWLTITIYLILGFTLLILASEHGFAWFSPFIYTVAYIGGRFSLKRALPMIAALVVCISLAGWLLGFSLTSIGSAIFYVVIVGLVVVFLMRVIAANQELRAAREEIARLAVTAERLRIARDLHDLLGHNLSLIALKSELARRLLAVSPERAATEIGDIEQVARTTLQEVREAVASYRQPALASELEAAEEILAAAGIAYKYEGDARLLAGISPASEAVLSWAVREGVTNIIKHSRAHHCVIALTRDEQYIGVEVADDGRGLSSVSGESGNGLCGLAERVKALDGHFEAASRPTGGFHLAVALPLAQRQHRAGETAPGISTPSGILHALDDMPAHTSTERED